MAILDRTPRARRCSRRWPRRARHGSLIAFDPNYRPRLWRDAEAARAAIAEALAVTDIALPTFPDEQTLFGDASAAGDRGSGWRTPASARSS